MKKIVLLSLLFVATFGLASCGNTDKPLTEAEQAKKYNMTTQEYKEMKNAAAQMNMTIEEHMNMVDTDGGEMHHDMMDMGDDSDMIEDDMEGMHKMEDGTMMSDDKMHMEMMHENDDIEGHGVDKHGEHE